MAGWSVISLFLFLGLTSSAFGTDGVFQGLVVDPPPNQPVTSGWIYIQGRNHALRRVEVSHAAIVFAHDVPEKQRRKCGAECLIAGLEIRVTAEQDSAGEWRAKRIEILKTAKPATEFGARTSAA
jgi:hypothetical protein